MLRTIERLVTHASDDGRWQVTFKKLSIGRPLEMTVKGSSGKPIFLKDILVGEVWVCSGQSNMEMGVGALQRRRQGDRRGQLSAHPAVHRRKGESRPTGHRREGQVGGLHSANRRRGGGWGGFSATAYFFGRELYKDLKVPIGLIHTSWGGTPAEFWTSRKALEANPRSSRWPRARHPAFTTA